MILAGRGVFLPRGSDELLRFVVASSPAVIQRVSLSHRAGLTNSSDPVPRSIMASRKRSFPPDSSLSAPGKRAPGPGAPQTDYAGWGAEETCRYLRAEGLGEWEDAFRGWSSLLEILIINVDMYTKAIFKYFFSSVFLSPASRAQNHRGGAPLPGGC